MPRRSVALLLAINLLNYADRMVLAAALPKIQAEFFAADDTTARARLGSLATAFLVSYMVTAPIFGWLADSISRWKLIGLAVIGWSLASGASGMAGSFTALLITRLFVGIGEAAYGPAAPTLLADLFPIERRGRVLSWFYMAIPVGSALGYALGGTVAQHWHWRWAFYLVVAPGVALGLACFFMPEAPRGAAEAEPVARRTARLGDYLLLLRTPSYVLNTLGMTALTFALGGVAFWMPDYVVWRGNPDLDHVSQVFGALTVVAGISATLLGGMTGDRLTRRWPGAYFLVSGVAMLLAFPCFQLVLIVPFPWCWGMIFVTEFCLFFNTGPTNAALANVTHPSVRASAFAINLLMIHLLGDAISPPLIGSLAGRYGNNMNIGFSAVSVAIIVGGLLWLWAARFLARDTRLAVRKLNV